MGIVSSIMPPAIASNNTIVKKEEMKLPFTV